LSPPLFRRSQLRRRAAAPARSGRPRARRAARCAARAPRRPPPPGPRGATPALSAHAASSKLGTMPARLPCPARTHQHQRAATRLWYSRKRPALLHLQRRKAACRWYHDTWVHAGIFIHRRFYVPSCTSAPHPHMGTVRQYSLHLDTAAAAAAVGRRAATQLRSQLAEHGRDVGAAPQREAHRQPPVVPPHRRRGHPAQRPD